MPRNSRIVRSNGAASRLPQTPATTPEEAARPYADHYTHNPHNKGHTFKVTLVAGLLIALALVAGMLLLQGGNLRTALTGDVIFGPGGLPPEIASAPSITLNTPINGANVSVNHTLLNVSSSTAGGLAYELRVYVGNGTDTEPNRLVTINKTANAITTLLTNFTALPVAPGDPTLVLLYHL
ncbi:hypothetical protein COV94_03125, partial [Candidatus Woesearchaeota archaeon CG11_big_fil_rev_8_21_14_0_20_57_5]